ncbi:hypothetical protein BDQ17DRAFT_1102570 [Cyathus striatus]|nr:hypothetical protein BDQ17DRAFT_1102570 [Cyathus striatus]
MPRKSSKNTDSISAIHRRRSNRTIPTAPSTTTASASASASASPAPTAFPAPIHVPLTTPIANPKNIDDINWRHPAELSPIYPTLSTQVDIIPLLQRQCFSIPPQPSDPKEQFCEIGIVGGPKVLLPLGYRIPLMFCGKYLWESVRLVLTSEDPPPEVEWENYKFDLLNLSRLCFLFLESARVAMGKKGKGGLSARWRSQMFDRVLTRYWWGWMVNREEYVRAFWMEFKEEEYERDVCRRDWKSMTLKGHKGFHLTPTELASGITAAQYTAGLTPLYDPYPNLYPTAFASLASVAPTPKIVAYKWDNEAYARANELVITGTRVDDDPRYVRIREEERRGYREGEWEGEEGRRRKRIKIEVDGGGVGLGFGTSVNASASKGGGVDKDGDIEMSSIHLNIIPTPPPHPYPHLLSSSPLSPVPLSPTSPTLSLSLPPPTPTPASASETPTPTLEAVANALALPALVPPMFRLAVVRVLRWGWWKGDLRVGVYRCRL